MGPRRAGPGRGTGKGGPGMCGAGQAIRPYFHPVANG